MKSINYWFILYRFRAIIHSINFGGLFDKLLLCWLCINIWHNKYVILELLYAVQCIQFLEIIQVNQNRFSKINTINLHLLFLIFIGYLKYGK